MNVCGSSCIFRSFKANLVFETFLPAYDVLSSDHLHCLPASPSPPHFFICFLFDSTSHRKKNEWGRFQAVLSFVGGVVLILDDFIFSVLFLFS